MHAPIMSTLSRPHSPRRPGIVKALSSARRAALHACLMTASLPVGISHAKLSQCVFTGWQPTPIQWTYTSPTILSSGVPLAKAQIYTNGFLIWDGTPNNYFTVYMAYAGSTSYNTAYQARNLNWIPGTALRISYECSGTGLTNNPLLSQPVTTLQVPDRNVYNPQIKVCFDLILTDPALYSGIPSGSSSAEVSFQAQGQNPHYGTSGCTYTWSTLTPLSTLNTSQLARPKPVTPTCSATVGIDQAITLNPVSASQIAINGAPRSAGNAGETDFTIGLSGCSKNAAYRIYFADKQVPGNQTYTLRQTNGTTNADKVGLRLYTQGSSSPIQFSNSITGTNSVALPSAAADKATVKVDLTAQYVLLPGVSNNEVVAGPFRAEATLRFVYD